MAGRVIVNGGKPSYAFEAITVSTTAIGFTATLVTAPSATPGASKIASYALVTVETNPIRYRTDGTDPTASVGHLLASGDVLVLDNFDDIRRFRAIRSGGADGTVMVSFF